MPVVILVKDTQEKKDGMMPTSLQEVERNASFL